MKNLFAPGFKSSRIVIAAACFILSILILYTCKKESSSGITGSQQDEILTAEEVAELSSLQTTNYTEEDVTLPNGMILSDFLQQYDPDLYYKLHHFKSAPMPSTKAGDLMPFEQKNLFLARMLTWGFIFTFRDYYDYPRVGPRTPKQHGLAYSYGQKFPGSRVPPPAGNKTICTDSLYGLDCSGLIYQMALNSGLPLHPDPINFCNATYESDTMTWVNAFKKNPSFKDLHMENLGQLEKSKIEVGDLIFWHRSATTFKHVGIVLAGTDLNSHIIFMSCGCATTCNTQGCIDNYTLEEKGPHQAKLTESLPSWYRVLRVKADMFPYKWAYFSIFSPSVASRAGKEVAGAYNRTWSLPCKMEGGWIVGSKKDNTYGSYIDSVMVKVDPVRHLILDFKVRRYVVHPEVNNYQHYEIEYLNQRGGPIGGNSDNTLFEVKGLNFTDHIDVISEYNERIQVGMDWVVGDEKLLRLVPDISSGFNLSFSF